MEGICWGSGQALSKESPVGLSQPPACNTQVEGDGPRPEVGRAGNDQAGISPDVLQQPSSSQPGQPVSGGLNLTVHTSP